MSRDEARRYFLIGAAIFVMAAAILMFGPDLFDPGAGPGRQSMRGEDYRLVPMERDFAAEALPLRKTDTWIPARAGAKKREFAEYYNRRAYPGAPPAIPHPVDFSPVAEIGKLCVACHAKGGFVPKYGAYAPVTPHPQFPNCRQCHVPRRAEELFQENDWLSVRRPKAIPAAMPGAPPPIPHSLQMRENCLACHFGPSAIEDIRVPHPERGNCRQCHVPRTTQTPFERNRHAP